jgi:hypothetical protein
VYRYKAAALRRAVSEAAAAAGMHRDAATAGALYKLKSSRPITLESDLASTLETEM